jgi:hypothetical protein
LSVSSSDPLSPLEIPVSGTGDRDTALVTCRTTVNRTATKRHRHGKRMPVKCTTKLVASPAKPTATTAVLTRGRHVYATGSVLVAGTKTKLLLTPIRDISKGIYTLTLTRRHIRLSETISID